MAIVNPPTRRAAPGRRIPAVFLAVLAGTIFAGESLHQIFAGRAEAEFQRAQTQFQSNPNGPAVAWQFARACFDYADFATNDAGRATVANQGIAACRQLLVRESNSVPGHYYLAMNLGQLAKAEAPSIAAYKLVRQIEREFKIAAELDARFNHAGPERSLGLLYRDAPGWPVSIGSRSKAREGLEQAVKLAPEYPENRLCLIESQLQWSDRTGAESELKTLDALWPSAQTNFIGVTWEQNWSEWSTRREAARQRLAEPVISAKPPKNSR